MPQPTRQQFDDAVKKVMATAPAGLSKDDFYKLVGKQLATPQQKITEPTDYWGGFRKGLDDYLNGVGQSMFESAAHPKTAGDIAGLLLPTTMGTGSVLKGLRAVSETEPAGNQVVRGAVNVARKGTELAGKGADAIPASSIYAPAKLPLKVVQGAGKLLPTESKMLGVDRYKPNVSGIPDGGVPTGELPRSIAADVEAYKPNVSGYVPGSASRNTTLKTGVDEVDRYKPNVSGIPDRGVPQGEMPMGTPPIELESAQDVMARGSGGGSNPIQTDRIPYGSPSPSSSPAGFGRLAGKAPTLEDALIEALNVPANDAAAASHGAPSVSVGGTPKPKIGKRPGGYTTDLPPETPTSYSDQPWPRQDNGISGGEGNAPLTTPKAARAVEEMPVSTAHSNGPDAMPERTFNPSSAPGKADKLADVEGGSDLLEKLMQALHPEEGGIPHINSEGHGTIAAPETPSGFWETMRSTEPEMDWHSGATPGSKEAEAAWRQHQYQAEMDAAYKRRIKDPKGD